MKPTRWTTLPMSEDRHSQPIPVYDTCLPGLVITPLLGHKGSAYAHRRGWVLTHEGSGRAVSRATPQCAFRTLRQAMAACAELDKLALRIRWEDRDAHIAISDVRALSDNDRATVMAILRHTNTEVQ